uniref:Uncharacterized protein n=1 Tax=Cucumis melo TaxID=3656 RepID=A0A9I9EK50_CUCME
MGRNECARVEGSSSSLLVPVRHRPQWQLCPSLPLPPSLSLS